MRRLLWLCCGLLFLLVGCDTQTSLPAPTSEPGQLYVHPSGVFSLRLPEGWSSNDQSSGDLLLVAFTPPSGGQPAMTLFAARLADGPLDDAAFSAAQQDYLAAPYNSGFVAIAQETLDDGSVRVTGSRQRGGGIVPVNVFMQRDGPYFSALEVAVNDSAAPLWGALTALLNSYQVAANTDWPLGSLAALPTPAPGVLEAEGNLTFGGLLPWTDDLGRFHITGQLANRDLYAVEQIEVRATLYDASDGVVAEQVAAPPVRVLDAGEAIPFDVRFDGGKPPSVVRYELRAAATEAAAALETYYGPAFFSWEDNAEYDEQGLLHVRGTATNNGDRTAYHTQAIVTVLDNQDRVAGYFAVMVGPGELAPGDSQQFDAPFPRLGGEPARYLVTVQAQTTP